MAPRRHTRAAPRGFTLVEIAVMGAVVGILALVAFGVWRLFSERATEDTITLELQSAWEWMRADAAANNTSPIAAADAAVQRLERDSQFAYHLETSPPSVVGWTVDRDLPLCAQMVIPDDPDVSSAPAGPCDHMTLKAMERLDLAGWWPLTDAEGSTEASTDHGPDATATGFVFREPPAALHAVDSDEDYSASVAGGRLEFFDGDGIADASHGLTMGLWTTSAGSGQTLAQVGDGTALMLGLDGSSRPTCTSGGAAATSQTPVTSGEWRLYACRLHPNGEVSVTVDGIEVARDQRPDQAPPEWSAGNVYPVGGPTAGPSGHVDHPFVASQPLSDGLLRALWGTSVAELPDTP